VSAPQVSVFVWHQCENNRPYFDLTIQSLGRQIESEDFCFETICVNGSPEPISGIDWGPYFKMVNAPFAVSVSEKFELAMMHAHSESTHTLLLSDDVICSKTMIYHLYQSFRGREAIINPFSNSDCQSLYEADIEINEPYHVSPVWSDQVSRLKPDMRLEDLEAWELEAIMNYPHKPHLLVPFPMISFFCTMIPKSVWQKVGRLDPLLEHRHNDQDFCLRAQMQGIPSFVQFGTFAFHFGSRTINQLANEESKAKCSEHFRQKWKGVIP